MSNVLLGPALNNTTTANQIHPSDFRENQDLISFNSGCMIENAAVDKQLIIIIRMLSNTVTHHSSKAQSTQATSAGHRACSSIGGKSSSLGPNRGDDALV